MLATLARQHYRLCSWRVAADELNYRRFFDVTTLTGVRVELPSVFAATHEVILGQLRDGMLDGLRIDHPDGLADPGGYLDDLAEATGGAWVVVEKILEPGEALPGHWQTAGTTGYDVLNDVLGIFVDPAGEAPLTALWQALTGTSDTFVETVARTKRLVLSEVLSAEVNRLVEVGLRALRGSGTDVTRRGLREALVEVLASFGVYRAYLPPTGPADDIARHQVDAAVSEALRTLPGRASEIDLLRRLVLAEGPVEAPEFVTRFQQTCGPVMAKGVEDTAFYRYLRLTALNEVGGDPGRFGLPLAAFHNANAARQRDWPLSMTTLSTHDTKRSEDVRARLVLLAQCPAQWSESVLTWAALATEHRSPAGPDAATEQLIWQTLVGAWPISPNRAVAYVEKATREAKDKTSWTDPSPDFDTAVETFVRRVLADAHITDAVAAFVAGLSSAWHTTSLAQKTVQLTVPGVADTYQGSELWDLSLVDPDNRRPVDYDLRRSVLASLDGPPPVDETGAAKLHVVATLLRLRRERPELFLAESSYEPLDAGPSAVAYARGGALVTVAPIRALTVERDGWGSDAVTLPGGTWTDVLGGGSYAGTVAMADLLAGFPVAVLIRAT
ncbi:MAG: malto-oligosyltrehalose synthase [Frankiales bacterium]|nr:malto-oligosyltrehalose synthase [Frankiales bacterium]